MEQYLFSENKSYYTRTVLKPTIQLYQTISHFFLLHSYSSCLWVKNKYLFLCLFFFSFLCLSLMHSFYFIIIATSAWWVCYCARVRCPHCPPKPCCQNHGAGWTEEWVLSSASREQPHPSLARGNYPLPCLPHCESRTQCQLVYHLVPWALWNTERQR